MQTLILIAGFVGAWLLVAGALYQASLELQDENIERDRIEVARQSITPPPAVSAWWWLLPPVKLILERRRSNAYRQAYFSALSSEDMQSLVTFISKATGWFYVASGGFLLAAKETFELSEHYGWDTAVFLGIVIVLIALCISITAAQVRRSKNILELTAKPRGESTES